jgi:Ca2+-binding EF-hand superfamily protein
MVSKEEWTTYQKRLFSMIDSDKSGTLSGQEFMHGNSKDVASFATGGFASALRTQEMFSKIDTDGDGQISSAEFTAHESKVFEMMDTGRKGMLDKTAFIGRGGQ